MAQAKKIEKRTELFIEEYDKLRQAGKIAGHSDLLNILGINNKSTISEILAKRQNIQPGQWLKFKEHFSISETSEPRDKDGKEPTIKEILMVLAQGFTAQAETLKSIESKMARQDSQARIEANLNEALAGLETLSTDHEKMMVDLEIIKSGKSGSFGGADNK